MPAHTKTSFLILSDTHDLDLEHSKLKFSQKADVILHCGDLTENGTLASHKRAISMLANMEAELRLVIAGNHEVDLDQTFFQQHGGNIELHQKAVNLWRSPETRAKGIVFLDEGTHTFTLKSGATFTIHASPYTPRYGEAAFQYPTNQDRYNKTGTPAWAECVADDHSAIPDFPAIDILMTHGPPKYILDNAADRVSGGCEHLRRAVGRCKPRLHCFGHIHSGWGARRAIYDEEADDGGNDGLCLQPPEFVGQKQCEKKGYATVNMDGVRHGEQTMFVNAAIMDAENDPSHVPWLVHLELPTAVDNDGFIGKRKRDVEEREEEEK